MAARIVGNLVESGINVKKIVTDGDSSTINAIHENVDPNIEHGLDTNHVSKNLRSSLEKVKRDMKSNKMESMLLTDAVIERLCRCFSMAVKKNRRQPIALFRNLMAIIPHYFGDHSLCGEWCKKKAIPVEEIRYIDFPNEKPLQGDNLRVKMESVMEPFLNDEQCEKLATEGDTNMCEAVHSLIRLKLPKDHHYAGSERVSFGVASAVGQVNVGNQFAIDVLTAAGIPVSRPMAAMVDARDARHDYKHQLQKQPAKKARRQLLKIQKRRGQVSVGFQYGSGGMIGLVNARRDCIPGDIDAEKLAEAREYLLNRGSGGPTTFELEFGDFFHSETSQVHICSRLAVRRTLCHWLFKAGITNHGLKLAIQYCEHDTLVAAVHEMI